MTAAITPAAALAQWLQHAAGLGSALRLAHGLGFVLLLAGVVPLDLRLLGAGRALALRDLARLLLPLSGIGALLLVPSGVVLFAADAPALLASRLFLLKFTLLLAASGNAVLCHQGPFAAAAAAAPAQPLPWRARLHAAVSLLLWLGVLCCGRLLARH